MALEGKPLPPDPLVTLDLDPGAGPPPVRINQFQGGYEWVSEGLCAPEIDMVSDVGS